MSWEAFVDDYRHDDVNNNHAYPEQCHLSITNETGDCPICHSEYFKGAWTIEHTGCGNKFCAKCLVTWARTVETETTPSSCPMCRGNLGFLISDNTTHFIVRSLDELRQIIGDRDLFSTPILDRQRATRVPWTEIDLDLASTSMLADDVDMNESFRAILRCADEQNQPIRMLNGDIPASALLHFDTLVSLGDSYGPANNGLQARVQAMHNDWVFHEYRKQRNHKASLAARRVLNALNEQGVRYFDVFHFPSFSSSIDFYVPTKPVIKILDNLPALRRHVALRLIHTEYNQAAHWLEAIWTEEQLRRTFSIARDNSEFYFLQHAKRHNMQGYAIWLPSDSSRYANCVYAVPRAFYKAWDVPLEHPTGALFVGTNGPDEMYTTVVDWAKLPAGTSELWADLFRPDIDPIVEADERKIKDL